MKCPQCGAVTPDDEWNCGSCRMNVYWASRHYDDLAQIRSQQGLRAPADTPSFLLAAHDGAMTERADHGGRDEHRVRQIARRAMRATRQARPQSGGAPSRGTGMEATWNGAEED